MSEQLISTPGPFGENGNFLLERELGTGGMGGVYMGRDKMLDRPVAVKVMLKEYGSDAEFVEKFKKEAQSVARLIHPNIAQVYSYGICDGMPYIAMELASGGSLYSIMNANPGKTDVSRVIKICQQVAQALQCATDQGCVHGDVKPENILLDANGNAKLVDFGLAAMQKDTDEIWGTPYYISPEKVKKEPIDFRADMYSLGGTLYHALTGVAPFEGEDSIAVVKKRFEGMPKKPSEIRPELTPAIDNLVMTMLALEKSDRYPSFEALLEAFKAVLTTGLTSKLPTPTVGGATARTKRLTTVRGRRPVMMNRKGGTIKKKLDGEEGDEGALEDSENEKKAEDEEDEEGGGNLALKVVGIVIGSILLIGGVIGGLLWYQVADRKAREADERAQITRGTEKARGAIGDTIISAKGFADKVDELAGRAVAAAEELTKKTKDLLPPEFATQLKPAPNKALLDAIASTNEAAQVAEPPKPAVPAPATNAVATATATNAPAAKVAVTNAPAAKQDVKKDAKKEAKPEAKPEDAAPPNPIAADAIAKLHEVWSTVYDCQAAAINVRRAIKELVAKTAVIDGLSDGSRASMEKLAEISRNIVDQFEQIKMSKDVENVTKWVPLIRKKSESLLAQTEKRLRLEKLELERKRAKAAADEAEKERLAKIEAEKKALVEEECKAATDKFDAIVAQGCFRQLDWKTALRQLENAKSEFKTAEGQLAADIQIRKVNDMKKVQDILIKAMNGHVFKGKLKGGKVTAANEKEIVVLKGGKNKANISWPKFYRDYPGNLNEVINAYIVNARASNAKYKLNLRDWADAVCGAALTMQLVCSEVNGAVERANQLVHETVKQFPDYKKTAQEMFPDMEFEETEE